MTLDRRFAIVIGINDYTIKPLDYCVNDALAVANILEEKCSFQREDIFVITSATNNPTKDISGHLDNALKHIARELKPSDDSMFFYFAGHGQYHFENSGLQFHDSLVEIGDIFDRINNLQPKYQCYVIDACESGGKVLTRGVAGTDLIEKYISKSSGILFMYASTENEKAKEFQKIKHGLFTYYFLDAVNNESLYDGEGILTPNRIQDYIARETSKESQFKQTPVIENRTIGYYPFAFKSKQTEVSVDKQVDVATSRDTPAIDKVYFPHVPTEIRRQVSVELKALLNKHFDDAMHDFTMEDYELNVGNDFSLFGYDIESKLTDKIVDKSREEGIEAVHLLFSTERQENTQNTTLIAFGLIDAFMQRNKPKYIYYNRIQWGSENVMAYSLYLKSKSIYKASCGITIVVYQAIYGIGMATASFHLDYTGYTDTQLNGPVVKIEAFKIHSRIMHNVEDSFLSQLNKFKGMIPDWNAKRAVEIASFEKKSK